VRDLVLDVEAAMGRPQDIEWAWDGEVLHLLQARPITVTDEADDGFDTVIDGVRYTTAAVSEMLPGVIPPLLWDTTARVVDHAMLLLFADLGAPVIAARRGLVHRAHGRAAVDLDTVHALSSGLRGIQQDVVDELTGGGAEAHGPRRTPRLLSRLRHDLRAARVRRTALRDADVFELAVPRVVASRPELALLGDGDLLAYQARLVDFLARGTQAEVAVAAAAAAAFASLEAFLDRYLESSIVKRCVADLGRRPGLGAAESWLEVARSADSNPAGQAFLSADSWEEASTWLDDSLVGSAELGARFRLALREGGSRAIPGGDGWEERPDLAWVAVQSAARRLPPPEGLDIAGLRHILESTPRWQRLLMLTGFIADPQGLLLGHHVDDAQMLLGRREALKRALLTLGGELRRVHLDVGRRLVERGKLERPQDVDLLGMMELTSALAGEAPAPSVLLRRRRRLEQWSRETVPQEFIGSPVPEAPLPPAGDRLSGWPASSGVYEGPARVVLDPAESIDLGDVIVASQTDASWVPLFLRAGALVVERGGPLSHAAVVARELGLPAVVNVSGAVARLGGSHAWLHVDGSSGEIVIAEGPT
jgi:rifampicin phosphotransferase